MAIATTLTRKGKTMKPTAADYERLARAYLQITGQDPEEWEWESIDDDNSLVSATRETLEDFKKNRLGWNEPGKMEQIANVAGLYWPRCQAVKGQPRCELTVVDCGDFRLIYQL